MDTQELDVALDELESRLDRLRSLYEQYFLGIEKIEPAIARKDVDRRFWILRRVKIRNTARRFRMQVLIQRYNTFQQYWARICREIENGTYVRHLLRAQKKAGDEALTWAAKKRLGHFRRDRAAGAGDAAGGDDGSSAEEPTTSDMSDLLRGNSDLAEEGERSVLTIASTERRESAVAPTSAARAPQPRGAFTLEDLGPLDLDFDDEPPPAPKPVAKATAPAPAPAAANPPAPVSPSVVRPVPPVAASPAPAPSPTRGALPMPKPSGGAVIPTGGAPAAPNRPAISLPNPAGTAPVARPAAPSPGPAAARPAAMAGAGWDQLDGGANRPKPGAAPTNGGSGLSDDRVRALHSELVAAKRTLNQGDAVSVDSLARTLRETEKKLRAQHQGKNVDFQIVVRDGKPIVKPIVRK